MGMSEVTAGRRWFGKPVCAALGAPSPGCPLTFPGAAFSAPCVDATALCKFIPRPSSLHTLNLTPNYKIIGNPTSFYCKTIPPRVIIFNSLLLASMG